MTERSLGGKGDERPGIPAELVDRIATPLRAEVTLDDAFEGRVMRAVRAAAASPSRGWWQRGYTLRLTPLSGLAMAAGVALAAVLGRMTAPSARDAAVPTITAAAPTAAHDTVYVVRFTLVHPDARRVSLVGDFNGWTPGATPLTSGGVPGVWSASVPVSAGRHEYAFIVDGQRWVADPYATAVHDEFGASSSVVHVGDASDHSGTSTPAI